MKRWFGGNDAKTSESCFWTDGQWEEQLAAVRDLLLEMEAEGAVELCFVDDESPRKVVAYRFTSDRGYDLWMRHLMAAGGSSLGRGVWDPFHDSYQYDQFFDQDAAKNLVGGEGTK